MIRKKGKPEGVVLIFIGLAVLVGLTDSLNKLYWAERSRRAEEHYQRGEALARSGNPAAAVDEYHAALTFQHNDSRYDMALAVSLMSLGRLQEAESHLIELHARDPNNAEIDLLLARIAAREGRTEDAAANYHQAIYGLWPADPKQKRIDARFEVVDLLARAGQKRQALADLLALADEAPDEPAVLDRAGSLLLAEGSPEHAADLFARALADNPRDAAAALGVAQAEFQRGNYSAAASRARRALRLDGDDAAARRLIDKTDEILSLDPTLVSLSAAQRYERSRTLVRRTTEALEACFAGRAPAAETQALLDSAHTLLSARKRHEGDTPAAISLAEQIWQIRQETCGRPQPEDETLGLVMAKVAK